MLPMELTKEYFDQTIAKMASKEDLQDLVTKSDLDKRLAGFAKKDDLKNFATKDDLKPLATKNDLKSLGKQLEDYTQDVADNILETIDFNFRKVEGRLDVLETEMHLVKTTLHLTHNNHA